MKKRIISYIFSAFSISLGFAQCPVISFDTPADVCLNETVFFENILNESTEVSWDFCGGDILNEVDAEELTVLSSLNNLRDIVTEYESGYGVIGFVIGENNKLLRIRFGETIQREGIQVQEITAVKGLNVPKGITKVIEGGQKYLLIGNSSDGSILKISFGNTYTNNSPSSAAISGIVGLKGLRGLSSYKQGNRLVAFAGGIGVGNSQVGVLDFPTGVNSTPVQTTINISGAGGLNQVRAVNDCGRWIGLVSSFTQNKIYKLVFGGDLRSLESSHDIVGVESPLASELRVENGNYFGLISSISGDFWRINFGENFESAEIPQLENLTSLGVLNNSSSFSIHEHNSQTVGLFVGLLDKKLSAVRFADACGASIMTSKVSDPKGLTYSLPGVKTVSMTGRNADGSVKRVSQQLNVQDSQAPQVNFAIGAGNCANNPITFSSQILAGSASSYQWVFDGIDGTTDPNSSFSFTNSGIHIIQLRVSDGICTNTVEKALTIYEELDPPTFTLVGSLCTNNQISVANTSDDGAYPEGTVQYKWYLDDDLISSEKAPIITFPTPGSHELRLVRSIPGCSTETSNNLLIDAGPIVELQFSNSCWDADSQLANVEFITSVEGENYSYTWDFGDNSTSSEASPEHVYETEGDYNIAVTVLDNSTGCSITTTPKVVSLYDLPISNFEFTKAYEDVVVEFMGIDLTPASDEVIEWEWDFAGLGNSPDQNPNFVFSEKGVYPVVLKVFTDQGCTATLLKNVEVEEYSCPNAVFDIQSSVCIGETVNIKNSSIRSESFEWDFCMGGIGGEPAGKTMGVVKGSSSPFGLENVAVGDNLYSFIASFDNSKLLRLQYDASANIVEETIELGDLGGLLLKPVGVSVTKVNEEWIAFVGLDDGVLLRLDFGADIRNLTPSVTKLEGLSQYSSIKPIRDIEIVADGDTYKLLAVGHNALGRIVILDFGEDLKNLSPIESNFAIPGLSTLQGISVLYDCNAWYGLVIDFNSGLRKVNFGAELKAEFEGISNISGISQGVEVEFIEDKGKYYGLVASAASEQLYRVNFGATLSNNAPTVTSFGSLGVLERAQAFGVFRIEQGLHVLGLNRGTSRLVKLEFPQDCPGNIRYAIEKEPNVLFFEKPGEFEIVLRTTNGLGSYSTYTRTITVTDLQASPIDFSLDDSRCVSNTNQFNFIGDAAVITSYSWDFDGDGVEDSSEANPAWQFPSAGEYEVMLTVGNANGCTNSAKKTIPIYNVPSPVFEYEATGVVCSHQAIPFNDLTEGLPEDEAQVTYLWDFNGEGTSTEKNPAYAFETAGQKTITLTIGIPGCEGTSSQNMTLVAGSKVAFNMGNQCEDAETTFENLTMGDGITGYQWEFGNGYTSTQASPSIVFDAAGDYNVKLTATNQLGCENTLTKKISQRGVPRVDFANDLACSGTTMQFTDKSTVPLANVSQWSWDFGGLGTSAAKNPQFVFPAAGEYNVSLTATSNYGCSATLVKKITVVEGATANFAVNANCVGLPVTFTGQSTSAVPITSRFWTINGKSYTTANVSEVFATAGQYEVTLEVTNSNLCTSSLTKTFEVYPLPQASFEFNSSCTNEQIEFVAASDTQVDVISRVWDFAGQAPANGARAYHQFKQAGDYAVSLEVVSADGCRSATTKTVSVNQAPTAAFSHTSPYGQLPVSVQFSDMSTGSTGRLWFVGDGLDPASDEQVFSHTFEQEGSYLVSLLSLADNGCSDTLATVVKVAPPKLDLQLKAINYTESNGVLRFVPTIVNRGTMDVSGFTILINIDDRVTASEVYEGTVEAGQTLSPSLAFELVPGQNGVEKVCMELVPPSIDSEEESSHFDNYNCLSVSGTFQTGLPYPNPVEERIAVDVILPADGEVEIAILTLSGQPVTSEKYTNLKAGLTTFTYEVAHYKPGLYLLRIRCGGAETIQRIVKR